MIYHALLQIGIYVILIVGFAFVIMLAIKPFFVRKQILQNGALVEGCIIEHRREFLWGTSFLSNPTYYLTYRYEYQGTTFTQETRVTQETYLAYPVETRMSVCCMPDDPTRAAAVDFWL
jgi:hypothetical protein